MNVEQAREWLLDYTRQTSNAVLEYNIGNETSPNRIWKQYAKIRAEQEGLVLAQAFVAKEAESAEEVRAVRLAEKLYGFVRIGREGIVYRPDWLVCDDEGVLQQYCVAEPAEKFLERHGKLIEIANSLTDGEREILRKLI